MHMHFVCFFAKFPDKIAGEVAASEGSSTGRTGMAKVKRKKRWKVSARELTLLCIWSHRVALAAF